MAVVIAAVGAQFVAGPALQQIFLDPVSLPGLRGGDLLLQGAGAHLSQGLPWTRNLPRGQRNTAGRGRHLEAQWGRRVWFLMEMCLRTLALGETGLSGGLWWKWRTCRVLIIGI